MKLDIAGGSMEITDDNKTIVTKDVAKEIEDGIREVKENTKNPDIIIKD